VLDILAKRLLNSTRDGRPETRDSSDFDPRLPTLDA